MPSFDVDTDAVPDALAEVVRATGEREYFRVYIDGSQAHHVVISKEEYIERGGEVQPLASSIELDLPVGEIRQFQNIITGEKVGAAILSEDILAEDSSFWVSPERIEEGKKGDAPPAVEFAAGNVVLKFENGDIVVMAPSIFEREFKPQLEGVE